MSESPEESLVGHRFANRSLRGARFDGCDLSGVVIRGSDVAGMEVDSPWLIESGSRLVVNGIDVVPFVDGELNRRFPGRELRTADDPQGLREAWAAVEATWAQTLQRANAMPPSTVEASVGGEWSLAQTLRHLVMATDVWLGRAILERADPYHPLGMPNDDGDSAAYDGSEFSLATPTFDEVLAARSDRQAMVRSFLRDVAAEDLMAQRRNPHDPTNSETVLSCVHTIVEEEWEHHRYAVRDLDALAAH